MKKIAIAMTAALVCQSGFAADDWLTEAEKFEDAFWSNQCDAKKLAPLLDEHFQYIHDDIGITPGREGYLKLLDGICKASGVKMRREIVAGSVHYDRLRDRRARQGAVYGVIVAGEHRFSESYNGGAEAGVSVGRFTHLLVLQNGQWVISQVMDYGNERIDAARNNFYIVK